MSRCASCSSTTSARRLAIRQALEGNDVHIVGEAATAEEAIALAPTLRPDLLLLDIDMPGLSGIEAVRELAPRLPETRIVMLTVSTDRRDLIEAIRSTARPATSPRTSPARRCCAPSEGYSEATCRCRAPMPHR